MKNKRTLQIILRVALATVGFSVAGYLFLYPAGRVAFELTRPGLAEGDIPPLAFSTHKHLAPRYERWAEERLASGHAADLTTDDLVETEWPLFGTLFFLWATEALQEEWETNPNVTGPAPKDYAAGAIEASAVLLTDPNHATWVKQHWGNDYLHRENVFYRMMLIGGLTAHHNLTDDPQYLDFLRDQVETLSAEIDASPSGLLDDYPGECYPGDVLAAIACIRRADEILNTDHSLFAARALRAFKDNALDELGLVPFMGDPPTGEPVTTSRGSGNAYVSLLAPELWPDEAAEWYRLYEEHYWKRGAFIAGFREYPRGGPERSWDFADMDAGPVVLGYGMAASAFGVGAARVNGRLDHAYPLAAELIAASWPLPNGTLLIPRALSSATDAPYLGEACILYNLTRQPANHVSIKTGSSIPLFAYACLTFYLVMGILTVQLSLRELQQLHPNSTIRLALMARASKYRNRPCSGDTGM